MELEPLEQYRSLDSKPTCHSIASDGQRWANWLSKAEMAHADWRLKAHDLITRENPHVAKPQWVAATASRVQKLVDLVCQVGSSPLSIEYGPTPAMEAGRKPFASSPSFKPPSHSGSFAIIRCRSSSGKQSTLWDDVLWFGLVIKSEDADGDKLPGDDDHTTLNIIYHARKMIKAQPWLMVCHGLFLRKRRKDASIWCFNGNQLQFSSYFSTDKAKPLASVISWLAASQSKIQLPCKPSDKLIILQPGPTESEPSRHELHWIKNSQVNYSEGLSFSQQPYMLAGQANISGTSAFPEGSIQVFAKFSHALNKHENQEIAFLKALDNNNAFGAVRFHAGGIVSNENQNSGAPFIPSPLEVVVLQINNYSRLDTIRNLPTLCYAIRDVARGLWAAWSTCHIHHRNISPCTVMLNDLSYSRTEDELSRLNSDDLLEQDFSRAAPFGVIIDYSRARRHDVRRGRPGRITVGGNTQLDDAHAGFYEFHSRHMYETLDLPKKDMNKKNRIHTLPDDFESLLYVLVWALASRRGAGLQSLKAMQSTTKPMTALIAETWNNFISNALCDGSSEIDGEYIPTLPILNFLRLAIKNTPVLGNKLDEPPVEIDTLTEAWKPMAQIFVKYLNVLARHFTKLEQMSS